VEEYSVGLNPAPNPADLPWTVYRYGRPLVHYRHKVYADQCMEYLKEGLSLDATRQAVRDGPDLPI